MVLNRLRRRHYTETLFSCKSPARSQLNHFKPKVWYLADVHLFRCWTHHGHDGSTIKFYFQKHPSHCVTSSFCKNKTFCFARARLSIVKTFCKTGIQRKVIKFKEGNAGIVLTFNSYHLMHQASEKDFKSIKEVANAPGLAFVYRWIRLGSADVKIETFACLMFHRWCSLLFFYLNFFVF
jgi:hypothetical protein